MHRRQGNGLINVLQSRSTTLGRNRYELHVAIIHRLAVCRTINLRISIAATNDDANLALFLGFVEQDFIGSARGVLSARG